MYRMKAIQVINPGKKSSLEIQQIPTPAPDANEILVKIKATAVNRADLHQRSGHYPPPEGASEILGLEMAGIVEQVGHNVSRWQPGDKVYGLLPGGGYAEYCIIAEKMALLMPENLSFEEAAAIPETFLTAFQALCWLAETQQSETVLIHAGGSGVGTAAIQLAAQLFNAQIVTTAGKEHKLEACKKLGADVTINYKTQNFAEEITREWGENAIDVIVDFIGAPYWDKNIDVLNTDGRLVYLSFMGGHKLDMLSLAPILKKRLKIMGSTLRSRTTAYKVNLTQDFVDKAGQLIKDGIIRPVIDKTFDWENTEDAHRYMSQNKNTGKIVLTAM
jgi:putative PIG3 family NAD(P)H quinone oxidoreductase